MTSEQNKKRKITNLSLPIDTTPTQNLKIDNCIKKAKTCPWATHGVVDDKSKPVAEFKFRSSENLTKVYKLIVSPDMKIECNCGEQFGQDKRGHCKHAMAISMEIMQNIISSMKKTGTKKDVSELHNYLSTLVI
jgi:hypothetical protein